MREMSFPVIPFKHYNILSNLVSVDKRERSHHIRKIVEDLKEEDEQRYNVLKFLMEFAKLVVKYESKNLMVTYNISISFANVIFRTRHLYRVDFMAVNIDYDIMVRMISDFDIIFGDTVPRKNG